VTLYMHANTKTLLHCVHLCRLTLDDIFKAVANFKDRYFSFVAVKQIHLTSSYK